MSTETEPRDGESGAVQCYAPVAVTCWKTEDGKLFESEFSAMRHQGVLDDAKLANCVMENGGTIADALRAVGFEGEIDSVLERVTKDSKLVIEHWQCQRTAGYQPRYFEPGLSLYVSGDAGAWSGPYGSSVRLRDLVRYASNKSSELSA